jgi:murein DD-endopeptidase MepM/ murein hydrolase activator NlpD
MPVNKFYQLISKLGKVARCNWRVAAFLLLMMCVLRRTIPAKAQTTLAYTVQIGDTWQALALRHDVSSDLLQNLNPSLNPQRQPAIGSLLYLPDTPQKTGRLTHLTRVPTLHYLVHHATYRPAIPIPTAPILLDSAEPIREYPNNIESIQLSHNPAIPGQAFAFRALQNHAGILNVTLETTTLDPLPFDTFTSGTFAVGLRGVGAFYPTGTQELTFYQPDGTRWSQPILFVDGSWELQQLTFTGAAAAIDNQSIADERVRLFQIWEQALDQPLFGAEFQTPISDYVALSSGYGTRRSYDGGATYRTYHEGVDFAAYEGTEASASADGIVVVAETLYVRGGTVIINHGLGIYSGYYHLSQIDVGVGDVVTRGQRIGGVGTTGLSTGNHLHWDFLVTSTWVGADKWVERGMGCWVLEGLGKSCARTE